jgi:nitroreductase
MSQEIVLFTGDTIKKRVSCRTYKDTPLTESDQQKLRDFFCQNIHGPFGNKVRFELIELAGKEREEIGTLATYGFIKGARTFIVGAVNKGSLAMEDFGYCMEKNILAATGWGLGTCWLGGTFNRSVSAAKIHKREDEVVPAITPVGYPQDRRSLMDRTVRFFAKSGSRKAWEELFFEGDTRNPLPRKLGGKYEMALECVRLGPSASNRQPWRILKERLKEVFHFYLSRTPGYSERYPDVSLQDIDMGIALCHFEAGLGKANQRGSWKIMQAPQQKNLEYVVSWIAEASQ